MNHLSNPASATEQAITQVRALIRQTSPAILATVWRRAAAETEAAALQPDIKRKWADTVALLGMSSDEECAADFMSHVEKMIAHSGGRDIKDFLANVVSGILAVARGN